jgi:iron(III) transport system ATP-binding protein
MDEPFSNLDAALRDVTRREIRWTLKRARVNAVLVTHDQEEALSFCDRLAVMNAGRIEQEGKPEEVYFRPKTPFVAQFLGRSNMLRGKAFGSTAETPLGRISIFPETRGDVLLSVRPEHVLLTPPGSSTSKVHGVVVSREFRGHDSTFRFRCGDGMYLSHMEYTRDFSPGDPVAIEVREAGTVLGREPVGFNIGTNPTNS